jgi:Dna[CI] antecedent, DciA
MAGSSRPERRRRRRDPAAAGSLLGRWRRGGARDEALEAVVRAWPAAVGPAAAARSLPVRRSRAGVVTVACAGAGWAQELAARSDIVLGRLASLGARAPRELRFVVSEGALERLPGPARPAAAPRPSGEEREAARRAAEGVSDPDLRALLERAAAGALARARRQESPAKRGIRGGQ